MEEEQPITPHAVPLVDSDGQLTYIGDDGLRYVVGPVPESLDQASVEAFLQRLRCVQGLFSQIEALCRHWLQEVEGPQLDQREALLLLLSSLESALARPIDPGPPSDDPA